MIRLKTNRVYYIALLIVSLLAGCSNDADLFEGTDNFITSFSLTQNEITYNASFYEDRIIITVPATVILEGAIAKVALSENASIIPDPSTITEWDDETLFSVTSYDGTRKLYRYTVNRNDISAEGTIVLNTQEEVDAFGKLGCTSVTGSLVIGKLSGSDSVSSLAALYQLKNIAYSLIVNPTYSGSEFVGLDNLETVGGTIQMESILNLESITLPKLKSAGAISVTNTLLTSVSFPKLTEVANNITVSGPLSASVFSRLTTVGGSITFTTTKAADAQLAKIAFPVLETAGNLSFSYFVNVEKVELPELTSTGNLYLFCLNNMQVLYCPKLKEATGTITIPYNCSLSEVDFPSLIKAGNFSIENKKINSLDFPILQSITGKMSLSYLPIDGITNLVSLTEVGEIYIYDVVNIKKFEAPESLKSIGKLTFYYYSYYGPDEINIKGIDIGELVIRGGALSDLKIIGDDVFSGTLTFDSNAMPSGRTAAFPELEGFSEVDSLYFSTYITSGMPIVEVNGIKKINKSLFIPNTSVTSFIMPDLEEIGGYLKISSLGSVTDDTVSFPKLKTIGGYFNVSVLSTNVTTLSLPLLESVGGDFTLYTGYSTKSLTAALFPLLETIEGKLNIYAYTSASYVNTKMITLDGFSALTSVSGAEITNQSVLVSYQGLKNALSSFTASNWAVSKNSYNPTYDELVEGQWIKP